MQIKIKNLGAIKQAELLLGDLTILCGNNNTGKTYATYALFGFLSLWRQDFIISVKPEKIQQLLSEGSTEVNIEDYVSKAKIFIRDGCKSFSKRLPQIFASSEKHFVESEFEVVLEPEDFVLKNSFERIMGAAKSELFSITKKTDSPIVNISLLVSQDKVKITADLINRIIGEALKDILFAHLFPAPFIASAERTGAAIFRNELNFARNRLLDQMAGMDKKVDPFELLFKVYADYALPVKKNVDFTRQLEELAKTDSFIARDYPEILNDFSEIIGGEYLVTKNNELYFVPQGRKIKLTMDESSSAVRSLLDIGFYLRHVAKPGDLLMVDEPELNLHPENQRKVARLFARLVNIGVKVFITTHSDYIIKELNTLIMLHQPCPRLKTLAEAEGYKQLELLDPQKVRVYVAEEALIKLDGAQRKTRVQTLVPAEIDEKYGIEARSFDATIDAMNRIQGEIIWGDGLK